VKLPLFSQECGHRLGRLSVAERFPARSARLGRRASALSAWSPFVAIYVVACVAFIPGSVLTLGGEQAFGLWAGFRLV